jgi:SepF-like predicted cell division protein (DUF552 family)
MLTIIEEGSIIIICDICDYQIIEDQEFYEVFKKKKRTACNKLFTIHKECWNKVIINSMGFIKLLK